MTIDAATIAMLPAVEAQFSYLAPMAERLYSYTFDPPRGTPRTNAVRALHTCPVRSVRPVAGRATLDAQGFQLVSHRSAIRDFADEVQLRDRYYREAEELLKQVTGASGVFIFDHTARRHVPGAEDRRGGMRQPAWQVHVDQTENSGRQRVRDFFPDDADERLHGRVQVINLWRPTRGPVRDAPLGVCDAQSAVPGDLVTMDLIYRDRIGEIYSVTHNAWHRWYYVPDMNVDEVLLLKCFDSMTDGRARFAPHSAFADPTTPPGAEGRESIELRALVFHAA